MYGWFVRSGIIAPLLVGLAAKRRQKVVSQLKSLNELRAKMVGQPMDLLTPHDTGRYSARRKRTR